MKQHTAKSTQQINFYHLFFVLIIFFNGYSQEEPFEVKLSPFGVLETVYDKEGQKYSLRDIMIGNIERNILLRTDLVTCSSTSYFNLFFEEGSGMENTFDPIHNARRAVLCKVFEDLSSFINSPLTTTGNKVNIVVKNFANENAPLNVLATASSYYIAPSNLANPISGILDGEIWKTIHLGIDSYTNITNANNTLYHGKVAFNFNNSNIQWHTNLATNTPSNLYDLYTVALHEVSHALGFNSFIDQNGGSLTDSNYYSRYDTFLKTNSNISLLSIGTCKMYDLSFNSSLSPSVLRPGCSLPDNLGTGSLNTTICNNAIKYVGSSSVPVYTPTCFELGSSLSHFEDQLYPSCTSSYGNDAYFVLSNSNNTGITKRYLKSEERKTLCDIGYNVKTIFGGNATANGYFDYGGTECSGISVAGLNDGIDISGSYTFIGSITNIGETSTQVNLSGFLANDLNATSFECLQNITAPTSSTLSTTFGNNSSVITFTTTTPGIHLLRYVPVNGTQKGNITYVYVYIIPPPNSGGCSPTPSACDLVMNGNFEQYSSLPDDRMQIVKACGWNYPSIYLQHASDYFNSNVIPGTTTTSLWVDIPCNYYGYQDSKNNEGNGYANIYTHPIYGKKTLYTKLKSPLLANTNYQLSFDASLADRTSGFVTSLQAYLSNSLIVFNINGNGEINTVSNPSMLFSSPTIIRNNSGWDTITFNFTTTTGGEQYLYLGMLKNMILSTNTPSSSPANCIQSSLIGTTQVTTYYIDNVSLIPTNGAKFDLSTSICNSQNINDLSVYLSDVVANGVFSGAGVTMVNGLYSFNAATVGVGVHTIGYTYTNSSGCDVTLYDTIMVTTTSANAVTVDAINDDFSNMPINGVSGGVTTSVYANDIYNGLPSSSATLSNVSFVLVEPISIAGATINSTGLISIPSGTPVGTYTLTYSLSAIGNCNSADMATVIIYVSGNYVTPTLVPGVRANNYVRLIDFQSSGKSVISGAFTTYNNISKPYLARLNLDLTLDQAFSFSGNQEAMDIAIQLNDRIVAATWSPGFGGYSQGITRLLPNGEVDMSFNVGGAGISPRPGYTNNFGYSCAILPDGKILLGGDFYYYNGVQRGGIVRLHSNGTLDADFNPVELNSYYRSIAQKILVQPDGKILLLGFFSPPVAGATQKNIIRLNANGTLDMGFLPGDTFGTPTFNVHLSTSLTCPLAKMALLPDGRIVVVGAFTKYNGQNVKCIVRLAPNGIIDSSFNTGIGVERAINELLIEPSTNKVIIGGEFTTFGTTAVKKLIRLTNTGTLDTSFSIGTGTSDTTVYPNCVYCSNYIKVLKQQQDGKIIVGGKFTTFNGLSATNITRIFGSAGVQAKSSALEYQSEPEIDINPYYSSVLVYPNPSKDIFNIDLTEETEIYNTVSIFNVLGKKIYTTILRPKENNLIDLSHIVNGYYLAKLESETSSVTLKLIKN